MTQLVELAKKIALFAAEQQISVPTENQQTLSSPHGGTESVMSIHTHALCFVTNKLDPVNLRPDFPKCCKILAEF